MKKALLLSLLVTQSSWGYFFQYPEDRPYTSADQGYTQYGAPSIHGTGKFALTFDDGPHPVKTPILLNTLKKHNVKAIFFVITSQINNSTFPLIKRMLDEGHLVGSHGKFHDNSDNITKLQWKTRVKQSFVELASWYKKAGHVLDKPFYRFPYAAYGHRQDHHQMNSLKEISQELMKGNCIQFAFWDIDSGDWIPKMSGKEVLGNFKAHVEGGDFITYKTVRGPNGRYQVKVPTTIKDPLNGGVILQHDIQQSTIDGTELMMNYAKERGLTFVRLDEVQEFEVTKDCKLE